MSAWGGLPMTFLPGRADTPDGRMRAHARPAASRRALPTGVKSDPSAGGEKHLHDITSEHAQDEEKAMTKPARAKLSLRNAPVADVATVQTPVQAPASEMTCFAAGGTEIIFNATAALICHEGQPGQTEADVAVAIDAIMFIGAFAEMRKTGTFMKDGDVELNDPSGRYALIVDAAIVNQINEQRAALDAAAGTFVPTAETTTELPVEAPVLETPAVETPAEIVAEEPAFEQDAVFQQTPAEAVAEEVKTDERPAPTVETFEMELDAANIEFKTARNGSPCATIRMPGQRTHMAFGELAEYLQGKTSVTGSRMVGRSTNKIVAIDVPGSNDQLVETPRAA